MPKKEKDKKKKRKPDWGMRAHEAGKALSETGDKLRKIEASESSKTQALKDKLYIKRRGKKLG